MRTPFAQLSLLALAACTAANPSPASRVLAAHNALDALGAVRLGPVREGSLSEGATHTVELSLEARCYTVAAFASESVRALALSVLNEAGAEIASASQRDPSPTLRVCAPRAGRYRAALRALSGSGSYALAVWSGAGSIDRAPSARPLLDAREGSCGAPIPIALDTTVTGDVGRGFEGLLSGCVPVESTLGRSLVYRLEVQRPMRLTATLRASFDGAVSIRTACGPLDVERSCATFDAERETQTAAAVDPGVYFVVVDAVYGDEHEYQLEVRGEPLPNRAQACRSAPTLEAQRYTSVSLAGHPQYFDLECSPDQGVAQRVYRFELERRTRVAVGFWPGAHAGSSLVASPRSAGRSSAARPVTVAVRRSCDRAERSSACARSASNPVPFARTLDAGSWLLVLEHGGPLPFGELSMEQFREGDPAGPGDRCADAIAMQDQINGDTITMNDDVRSECSPAGGAIDQVFRLDLRDRTVVTLTPAPSQRTPMVLAWTDRCDALVPRAMCTVTTGSRGESFERVLDAGTHYLAVESVIPGSFSPFEFAVERTPTWPMERACAAAPLLVHGQRVRGALGDDDVFQSRCSEVTGSTPDRVYRLQLSRRSRVRIELASEEGLDADGEERFAPSAFVRAACALSASEVQCVDPRSSHGLEVLEPGTYFVVVTGDRPDGVAGRFSLRATVSSE